MKFDNGGWDLAYNVQVSTEASNKIVVAVEVTSAANDVEQLEEAVKTLGEELWGEAGNDSNR